MKENTSFNRINLSSNIISDEGVVVIANALRQDNTTEAHLPSFTAND